MSMFYKTCDKQLADTGSHMRASYCGFREKLGNRQVWAPSWQMTAMILGISLTLGS